MTGDTPHSRPRGGPGDDVAELVDALFDERLTEPGAEALNQLLSTRDDALVFYIQYLHQNVRMAQYVTSLNQAEFLEDFGVGTLEAGDARQESICGIPFVDNGLESETQGPAALPSSTQIFSLPAHSRRQVLGRIVRSRGGWAAAAVLLIAAAIAFVVANRRPSTADGRAVAAGPGTSASPAPIATLVSLIEAGWEGRSPGAGESLTAGPLYLTHGTAKVMMAGGANVVLRGPARIELESDHAIRLLEGHLAARLERARSQFVVRTPCCDVIDLGTQFAVAVDASGATQTQVVQGKVKITPTVPNAAPVVVTANNAARVQPRQATVERLAMEPGAAAMGMALIDLADIVAGGDGVGHRRNGGINVVDGARKTEEPGAKEFYLTGDGTLRPVAGLPMVAGVFVPVGGTNADVLDPAGHTFSGFPSTGGQTFYWLWAGGPIPVKKWSALNRQHYHPEIIDGQNYGTPGHRVLFMHASKGVVFDLAAIRRAHRGAVLSRFHTRVQNTAITFKIRGNSKKSDLWVFVDGQLRARRLLTLGDPSSEVWVDLEPSARYLTLVSTNGGDGFEGDLVTLGDPWLE